MNRRWIALGALLLGLGPTAAPLAAQERMSAQEPPLGNAVFAGVIVDSISGEPISGVMVRMDSGQEAFTDALGEFRFQDLPQGKRLFALLTDDCRITWGEITLVAGIPRRKQFRLPPAFGAAAQEEARVEAKRQRTGGRVLTADEIDNMSARDVMELIRRVAPNMVSSTPGDPGAVSALRAGRGRSMTGSTAPPVIVIDGVRMPGAEGQLSTMEPSEVATLEIQPGAAAGWEYGSSGASGVIKITLRRGLADGAEETRPPAPCVVPTFPRG